MQIVRDQPFLDVIDSGIKLKPLLRSLHQPLQLDNMLVLIITIKEWDYSKRFRNLIGCLALGYQLTCFLQHWKILLAYHCFGHVNGSLKKAFVKYLKVLLTLEDFCSIFVCYYCIIDRYLAIVKPFNHHSVFEFFQRLFFQQHP